MTENRAHRILRRCFALLVGLGAIGGAFLLMPLRPAWRHDVVVTYAGTRSEGTVGILRFQELLLPPWVNRIVTTDGRFFTYRARRSRPLHGGWQPTKGEEAALQTSDGRAFCSECAAVGFYRDGLRRGTPRDWLYLPELGVWTDARPLTMRRLFSLHGWTYTVTMNLKYETQGILKVHGKPVSRTAQHLVTPVGEFKMPPRHPPDGGWRLLSGRTCVPAPTGPAGTGKMPATVGVGISPRPPAAADDWCFCAVTWKWLAPEDATER